MAVVVDVCVAAAATMMIVAHDPVVEIAGLVQTFLQGTGWWMWSHEGW